MKSAENKEKNSNDADETLSTGTKNPGSQRQKNALYSCTIYWNGIFRPMGFRLLFIVMLLESLGMLSPPVPNHGEL